MCSLLYQRPMNTSENPMNTSDAIPWSLHSLEGNHIMAEGVEAIAAVLKDTQLSTLKCAAQSHPVLTVHSPLNTLLLQLAIAR